MTTARWALVAAVIAATSYIATWNLNLPQPVGIIWKGSGVALLAIYAALSARNSAGWLIALVMAFGALGDMLLEIGLIPGALGFLAGHLCAIWLYLSQRRAPLSRTELAAAVAFVPVVTAIAFLLPVDRAGAPGVAIYALGLTTMAATAWLSRFPRSMTALGALMFVVSDLLIFLRGGRPGLSTFAMGLAVWGLYFAGQALIVTGVVRKLAEPGEETARA